MSMHIACFAAIATLSVAVPAWGQSAGWGDANFVMRNGKAPSMGTALALAATGQSPCIAAAAAAERRYAVPHGLMLAIGNVETGRPDPHSGRPVPWPWSVNTGTDGLYFTSKAKAVAWVRKARAAGATSIDVGCMQVNLAAHPHAFANLNDAFDPSQNANYAARFLVRLHAEAGSWDKATAEYHSHTPALGVPYRKRVALAVAALKKVPETRLQMLHDAWAATLPRSSTIAGMDGPAWPLAQPAAPRRDLARVDGSDQSGEL